MPPPRWGLSDVKAVQVPEALPGPCRDVRRQRGVADRNSLDPGDEDDNVTCGGLARDPLLPVGGEHDVAAFVRDVLLDERPDAGVVDLLDRDVDHDRIGHGAGAVSGSGVSRPRPASLTVAKPSRDQYSKPPISSRTLV